MLVETKGNAISKNTEPHLMQATEHLASYAISLWDRAVLRSLGASSAICGQCYQPATW